LALTEKGKWTQVALKENGTVAWVYSSLLEEYVDIETSVTEEVEIESEVPAEEVSEPDEDLDF
jgi:hypothetical protein